MDPPKTTMSQKEYLQRYLMKDKGKRKKKKSAVSSSSHLKRSVIIDDDINLADIPHGGSEDFNLDHLGDEAPQIAGFIDERPDEVKMAEKYKSGKWKPVGGVELDSVEVGVKDAKNNASESRLKSLGDQDLSPPRIRNPHRESSEGRDSRKSRGRRAPSPESRRPHKSVKRGASRSPVSKGNDSDSDLDVPRKGRGNKKSDGDNYKQKRSKFSREGDDSDQSPPRKDRNSSRSSNREKPRRNSSGSDLSPPRRSSHKSDRSKDRRVREKEKDERMQDGKKAGLQDAKSLKDELRKLKDQEDEMFRKMNPELLGRSSAAIVRDRRTGLKRDFEKEKEVQREEAAKNAVRQKKYEKWGKGLKQVREQEEKIADLVYEMSKPMARYADDDDLDRVLKAQEREGDPMLEYIRNHQKESHTIDLTQGGTRKKYMGSYLPNRFNIAPGHRWDGVDRSSGYEQKWFAAKNAKKAVEEEAWKWSSADM